MAIRLGESDHIIRLCLQRHVKKGSVASTAFDLRLLEAGAREESYLSVRHQEHYQRDPMAEVMEDFKNGFKSLSGCKLAVLDVIEAVEASKMVSSVLSDFGFEKPNPSNSYARSVPDMDRTMWNDAISTALWRVAKFHDIPS